MVKKLYLLIFLLLIASMVLLLIGCSFDPPAVSSGDGSEAPIESPENRAPIANAGSDQTLLITEASNIKIDGSASMDPDNDELNFSWTCLGEEVDLDETDLRKPSFEASFTSAGSYYFMLVVDDGELNSLPSIVSITVLPPDGWVDDDFFVDNPDDFEFASVQGAIDFLGPGALIAVRPGTYDERVTVKAGVHLFGVVDSNGRRPEIRSSVEAAESTLAVVFLEKNTVLENLDISCTTSLDDERFASIITVIANSLGVAIQNCNIQTATGHTNSYVDGIVLQSGSEVSIRNETRVENISGEGIVAYEDSELVIRDSRVGKSLGSAIYTINSASARFSNIVVHHAGHDGFDLASQSVDINHCTVAYFNRAGIKISTPAAHVVKNSLVFSDSADPTYYDGVLSRDTIGSSNMPNQDPDSDTDPLFVDGENGNFELRPGSIAIGAAEDDTDIGAAGNILLPPE